MAKLKDNVSIDQVMSLEQAFGSNLNSYVDKRTDLSDEPNVTETTPERIYAGIIEKDHDALNEILVKTLSPQLKANEVQKRDFKSGLMKYIMYILIFQFTLVAIPILMVFIGVCMYVPFMREICNEQITEMFSFLRYYITATIAEFIAMLFFIVEFVFDKSIVGLIKEMVKGKPNVKEDERE